MDAYPASLCAQSKAQQPHPGCRAEPPKVILVPGTPSPHQWHRDGPRKHQENTRALAHAGNTGQRVEMRETAVSTKYNHNVLYTRAKLQSTQLGPTGPWRGSSGSESHSSQAGLLGSGGAHVLGTTQGGCVWSAWYPHPNDHMGGVCLWSLWSLRPGIRTPPPEA